MKTRALATLLLVATLPACGRRQLPSTSLFPLGPTWRNPVAGGVDGALAADAERVYFVSGGAVHALRIQDGAAAWKADNRAGVLTAAADLLVVREAGGTVWGLDPRTGSARWKVASGIPGTVPAVVDRDRVLVAGDGIAALEASGGRAVWTVAGEPKVSAPPAVSGSLVVTGEADGTVRARDAATGTSRWTHATGGGAVRAAPLDDEGRRLFVGTAARGFIALHADKGSRDWRWKVGADVAEAAAFAGRLVLFASNEAVLYGMHRGGNLSWRAPLPSRPRGAPLVFGTSVLIACHGLRPSESLLAGFDARTGRKLGDLKTPAELKAAPVVSGRTVVAALRDGTVAAWRLPDAEVPEKPAATGPSPKP
ncbi:MAG: PQQ-binding-like beta-propeller repeat protein [Vicinamibacteria bacterium]